MISSMALWLSPWTLRSRGQGFDTQQSVDAVRGVRRAQALVVGPDPGASCGPCPASSPPLTAVPGDRPAMGMALGTLWGAAALVVALRLPTPGTAQELITSGDLPGLESPAPDLRIPYGEDRLQYGHLRLPEGYGPHPVIVFIHGGCWLSEYSIRHVGLAEQALAGAGYAVWSLEYRRVGNEGGGWPGTFFDIAQGVDHLRVLAREHPLDLGPGDRERALGWWAARTVGGRPPARSSLERAVLRPSAAHPRGSGSRSGRRSRDPSGRGGVRGGSGRAHWGLARRVSGALRRRIPHATGAHRRAPARVRGRARPGVGAGRACILPAGPFRG